MNSKTDLSNAPTRDEAIPLSDEPLKPIKSTQFKSQSWSSARNDEGENRCMSWRLEAGTLLEIRASHLLKLVCLLILALAVVTITFHSRIRVLESQKNILQNDLSEIKLLIERMERVISLDAPYENSESQDDYENIEGDVATNEPEEKIRKVKRSAPGRTTKDLHYQSSTISVNSLNNDTSYGSNSDGWTPVGMNEERPKSLKGKLKRFAYTKLLRRLIRKELRNLNAAHRLQTPFRNLSQSQLHLQSSSLSHCNHSTSPCKLSNLSDDSGPAFDEKRGCRAAYLQIDGYNVNIRKPKQRIGPWYHPLTGNEIGFNGMWYNNLALDSNGTSIVFQEDGLFMIYAQIFYQLQHLPDGKPSPMGYRIYLKKNLNNNNHSFRRPVPIAECVPSFPSTFYQTCFTQVVWYVEAQDEIYLEHFMDSLPLIDALRNGQTFLGIVRL